MSDSITDDLQKLVAEAKDLKKYRNNGTIYREKCADLVERIKLVVKQVNPENLAAHNIADLKVVKSIIVTEERFSNYSFEARSVQEWKKYLDE